MAARIRSFLAVVLLINLLLSPVPVLAGVGVGTGGGGAQAAPAMLAVRTYDGLIAYSTVTNCASIIQGFPYNEKGIAAYTGFAADPEAGLPGVGQIYYVHVVISGMGHPCSDQRAYIDIQLPANTSLAISPSTPVQCLALINGAWYNQPADCPQLLPASGYNAGGYWIPSSDVAHARTWPLPQGGMWEIRIPLVSSTMLNGSPLRANVWALDGNSSPWLRPEVGIYVFSGTPANNTPTILYNTPSTTITTGPPADYLSEGYLYAFNLGGTAYFDLRTSAGSYSLVSDFAVIPAGGTAWRVWDTWTPYQLLPNTTYFWRVRFAASNGTTYTGSEQSFKTLPNGQVTIGSGSAASCTSAALQSALSSAGLKELKFDCGAADITIPLTGMKTVFTSLMIDGGNRVTLSGANAFRHFDVQSGAILTLNNLSLTNGLGSGCGGAIHVAAGGNLEANNVRMSSNHAAGHGGAVCVDGNGQASFNRVQITGNSAEVDGGAIYNLGSTGFMFSDISGNNALNNGGGIWNDGILDIASSLLASNSLPTGGVLDGMRVGGGLYNLGDASIYNSTVANNTSAVAGGIYNLDATIYLSSVTIADNTALLGSKPLINEAQVGGLQSSGLGSAQVRNTLIARNSPGNCGMYNTVVSLGHNLDSGAQCKFVDQTDQINTNPRMGSLAYAGGLSRTVPIYGGSPAIDAADSTYCGMYDQRGFSGPIIPNDILMRSVDGNSDGTAVCDIGAYEYRPMIFLPSLSR